MSFYSKSLLILWLMIAGVCAPKVMAIPTASRWVPQDAILVIDIARPRAFVDLLTSPEAQRAVEAMPVYQAFSQSKGYREMVALVRFLELALETDWRTGLAQLTGGGIRLAVCPEDRVLLMIDAEDKALLEKLHGLIVDMNQSDGKLVESRLYQGIKTWSFDGEEAHALIGSRFVLGNTRKSLEAALDLRRESHRDSLATKANYQAAQRSVNTAAVASVYVDAETLLQVPDISGLFSKQRNNPLAALFFAGITEAVRQSTWLAFEIGVNRHDITVQAMIDGKIPQGDSPAAFALPQAGGQGTLPNVEVPRGIAGVSLYRDLHQFYAAKDDLFPERTSGLIFFENMMGIFFTGRDLTDEILAQTLPTVRLVVAQQAYDPAIGTPQVQVPGFALVLQLRHPDQFDEIAEEAWQKALGLINFTRGQQAQPGLIIDRPHHRGTQFSVAYFSARDVEDRRRLDTRFNYRPALALPGNYLILSSTEGLARDLIDAVQTSPADPAKVLPQTHSLVEVQGTHLASILEANQTTMVQNNMIKKGHSQAEAENEIGVLTSLVRLVDRIKLTMGLDHGVTRARLNLGLKLP